VAANRCRRLKLFGAVAAATLLLVGCTSDGSAAGPNTEPEAAADIEIVTTVLGASEIDQAADSQGAFALDGLGQTTESTNRAQTPTSAQTSTPSTNPTSSSTLPDHVAGPTTLPAATTTTVITVTTTTAAPTVLPPWRVGLINTEGSSQGSFEGYRGGVDLFSDITLPIVHGAGVPILGGYVITSGDANATNALFDVGGLPAVFAAMASAAVAGIEVELISLPFGTVDDM